MGLRTDYLHTEDEGYIDARNDFFSIMIDRLTKCYKMNDTLFRFTSNYSHHEEVSKYLLKFAEDIIRLKRGNKGKVDEHGSFSYIDFFENLKQYTDEEIRDNINLLIVAVSATSLMRYLIINKISSINKINFRIQK